MIASIDGLTDRAYDALVTIYGSDNSLWAAVYAVGEICEYKTDASRRALLSLCSVHRIDPDQE